MCSGSWSASFWSSPGTDAPSRTAKIDPPSSRYSFSRMASTRSLIFPPASRAGLCILSYVAEGRAGLSRRLENQRCGAVRGRLHGCLLLVEVDRLARGLARIRSVGFIGILGRIGMAAGSGACRAAAVDEHHRALDVDPARVDVDEIAADFERKRGARFDHQVHDGLEIDLRSGLHGVVLADLLIHVLADSERLRAVDLLIVVALDLQVLIAF